MIYKKDLNNVSTQLQLHLFQFDYQGRNLALATML